MLRGLSVGFALTLFVPAFALAGSANYTTPGTYTFTVPAYGTLTVEVWGGGGGGAFTPGVGEGYASTFNSSVMGGGGRSVTEGGAGGAASGGDFNTSGNNGAVGRSYTPIFPCCAGGNAPHGGAGGVWNGELSEGAEGFPGNAPGGGGSGYCWTDEAGGAFTVCEGGGGSGAYSKKNYAAGALTPGSSIPVVVGAGAHATPPYGDNAHGGDGAVSITWTDAVPPSCSVTFDQNPVSDGDGTTIHWSSSNADWFYINSIGYVSGSGSSSVQPSQTTNYDGSVGNAGGETKCPATLTVQAAASGPCPLGYTWTLPSSAPQSQTFDSTGTFTVPSYDTLTVEVWGGGGAGGNPTNGPTGDGGRSSFNGVVVANGGLHGEGPYDNWPYETGHRSRGGSGGTASSGDVNLEGSAGASGSSSGGDGGNSPNGGNGGSGAPQSANASGQPGSAPGGGGGGGSYWETPFDETTAGAGYFGAGGGGGGAYASKTYSRGALAADSALTVVVGAGGSQSGTAEVPRGGAGASGRVTVTWTPSSSPGGGGSPPGSGGQGGQCIFTGCPSGYTNQNGHCVPNQQCAGYFCRGNDLYRKSPQCVDTLVQSCSWGCSGGSCLPPPKITFVPFRASDGFEASGHLQAHPMLVSRGHTTRLYWNATNVSSCTVRGSNGDSWTGASSGIDGKETSPLTAQTTYTLNCTGLPGATPKEVTERVRVDIIPIFNEQ